MSDARRQLALAALKVAAGRACAAGAQRAGQSGHYRAARVLRRLAGWMGAR